MNLEQYQKEANRTLPNLGQGDLLGLKLNLCHMVLGMGSELNELEEAILNRDTVNIHEEKIDVMWYVAGYCTLRGHNLKGFPPPIKRLSYYGTEELQDLYLNVSKLQDIIKKYIAYNKPIDEAMEYALLVKIIEACNYSEFEDGLDKNIAKLKARYPEKFTEELALNRNLTVEREILEGKN